MAWAGGEFAAWRNAYRELPQNPLFQYELLARKRRLTRTAAWRRNLLLILCLGLALFWIGIAFVEITADFVMRNMDLIAYIGNLLLMALILVAVYWGVRFITALYDTAIAVMGFLAGEPTRNHRLMLDDMSAISSLSDYDITAAVVMAHWPRLIRLAFGGSILYMLYLLDLQHVFRDVMLFDELTRVLILSPVTVAFITLGGLIVVLWLIAMGNNMVRLIYANLTGAMLVIGYFMYTPMILAFANKVLLAHNAGRPEELVGAPNVLIALVISLLFLLCYHWLYRLAESRPWARSFLGPGVPLVFLLGIGLMVIYAFYMFEVRGENGSESLLVHIGMAYVSSWGTPLLFNPLSVPAAMCYGWDPGENWVLTIEWFRYPLLLLTQLAMVAIGLTYARRAVARRRCRRA